MENIEISVFKSLFKSAEIPYKVRISKIIERIKRGTSKDFALKIREGNKELKKKLPAIVFSGIFTQRNKNGLTQHSGLMVLDFDNYPNQKVLEEQREILKANKHVVILFVSPSGNGLKAVIKVSNDLTKETHPQVFKAFNNQFKYDYFDPSSSNVDRVCFESYDPNIYVNYDAETFIAKTYDEGHSYIDKVPLIPINDEEVIINKIMAFDWKTDFREGERNTFIFNLASAFCEYGVTQSTAEGYIINNVVYGDFSERECITAIKSAYTSRTFGSKYFENYNKIEVIKRDLKNGKDYVQKTHKVSKEVVDKIEEDKKVEVFWYADKKGAIKIDQYRYKNYLEGKGFKKFFPDGSNKPTFVKVTSDIVEETSTEKIKDFVYKEKSKFNIKEIVSNYLLFQYNLHES